MVALPINLVWEISPIKNNINKQMKKILILIILISTISCKTNMNFTIEKSFSTSKIPSGSGIIKSNNKYYVVGDDSPYLFILDNDLNIIDQKELIDTKSLNETRIKKSKKPDFEAFEKINDQEFVIFGSGSKLPERVIFIKILKENNKINKIMK